MLRRWAAPATAVGLSLGFALVWLRVVYLQVVQAEQYRQQLQRQAFARVLLLPERGTILDRRGEPLALSVKAPSYAVDPQQLRCAECLCRAAHALGLDSATCLQRIRSARGRFLWLLRSVWERPTTAGHALRPRTHPAAGAPPSLPLRRADASAPGQRQH